jgi:magnesium transporter
MSEPAPIEPHETDDAYALDNEAVDAVLSAVSQNAQSRLIDLLEPLHPADIADLLEQISDKERENLIALWGDKFDPEVLIEVDHGVRDDLIEMIPTPVLGDAVKEMETDEIVYVVEDLDAPEQEKILDALDEADRAAVLSSLQFPEDSAGRMMQRELVMAPPHWTVGDTIDFMRQTENLPDEFYDIIIADPRMIPVGMVPLSKLMANTRETRISTLMEEDFRTIPATQSREDVGYAFAQYHLVSAPVVDDVGRLVGTITIDDAVEAMEEESREDMMQLAGVGKEEELSDSVLETARQRFPWLLVNLITAVIASIVISLFSETINAIVALAILMPIVASMGGNGGTQSLTVAVRAIATRDLTAANAWRIVGRETLVGLMNGAAFAIIIGIIGYFWFGSPLLGIVLAVAMVINMVVAGLAGILIPLWLDRLGVDPALASGAFVTTVTDIVGFFAFLGLAALLLL